MSQLSFESVLIEINEVQIRLKHTKEILSKIEEYLNENEFDIFCFFGVDYKLFIWCNFKDLTKTRKMLKSIFGEWQDRIDYISNTYNIFYEAKNKDLANLIGIVVNFEKAENMPKSLFKDGKCGFKEVIEKNKKWVYETEVKDA
jgi:hypothetical protein